MKTLSCNDFGVDCDYVAKGMTEDEVMNKAMEHVRQRHADRIDEMMSMPKEEIMEMIKDEDDEEF